MIGLKRYKFPASSIIVGVLLLLYFSAGAVLILHNPIWSLDDSTIIQSFAGSGRIMHLYDKPGYAPRVGRLFPLAYLHTNLLPIFSDGYLGAKPFMLLNTCLWGVFVLSLFLLCYCILKDKTTKPIAQGLSFIVLTIVCQRTFPHFTYLWTTICIDNVLSVLICLFFLYYLKSHGTSKTVFCILFSIVLAYFTFCLEVNISIPLCIFIGFIFAKKLSDPMSISCFLVFLLFILIYVTKVLPNTDTFYDSSHGSTDTIFSNAYRMLLLQKILFLVLAIFFYRLYRVLVIKDKYDALSDTLLFAGVAFMMGCFVMKLNWGLYYTIPIVFAIPASLSIISFSSTRKSVASMFLLLTVFVYHAEKYPRTYQTLYTDRDSTFREMTIFNDLLCSETKIIWYENESFTEDRWIKVHVRRSLKHLKKDDSFEMLTLSHISNGSVLLTPKNTSIENLASANPDLRIILIKEFAGLVLYHIEE